jgi:hypothetical protein
MFLDSSVVVVTILVDFPVVPGFLLIGLLGGGFEVVWSCSLICFSIAAPNFLLVEFNDVPGRVVDVKDFDSPTFGFKTEFGFGVNFFLGDFAKFGFGGECWRFGFVNVFVLLWVSLVL